MDLWQKVTKSEIKLGLKINSHLHDPGYEDDLKICDDMIMGWYNEIMIWWFGDLMIWWFDDLMIWWFDDFILWGYGDMM